MAARFWHLVQGQASNMNLPLLQGSEVAIPYPALTVKAKWAQRKDLGCQIPLV